MFRQDRLRVPHRFQSQQPAHLFQRQHSLPVCRCRQRFQSRTRRISQLAVQSASLRFNSSEISSGISKTIFITANYHPPTASAIPVFRRKERVSRIAPVLCLFNTDSDQVTLEAGNSASIIFKHYRELTTPEVAEKWFSILPTQGQWENTLRYDRKTRRVILNGVEVAALPVWLEFAIALSAFIVPVFSISALPSPHFPALQSSPRLRQAGRSDPLALSGVSRRKQIPSSVIDASSFKLRANAPEGRKAISYQQYGRRIH